MVTPLAAIDYYSSNSKHLREGNTIHAVGLFARFLLALCIRGAQPGHHNKQSILHPAERLSVYDAGTSSGGGIFSLHGRSSASAGPVRILLSGDRNVLWNVEEEELHPSPSLTTM